MSKGLARIIFWAAFAGGIAPSCSPTSPIPPLRETATILIPAYTDVPAVPMPRPSSTLIPPTAIALPGLLNSLFALERDRGLWRLDAESASFQRLTPPDKAVTSFSISPADGSIAYADQTGSVFILGPHSSEARSLLSGALDPDGKPYVVTAMEFAHSGELLAVAVTKDGALYGIPSEHIDLVTAETGVWLIDLTNGSRRRIITNEYPTPENSPHGHIYTNPRWSPDDQALSLDVRYWEGVDVAWLYPLDLSNQPTLHDPSRKYWTGTAWSLDNRGIYLFGTPYSDFANLDLANRSTGSLTTLLDGTSLQGHVSTALPLASHILFAASLPPNHEPRLYLGHQTAQGFVYYEAAGAASVCNYPRLLLASDMATVLVKCYDKVIITSSEGEPLSDITDIANRDITTSLSDLTFEWGPLTNIP